MASIDRRAYAEIFGPTVGDRVRLADTDLRIEVEQDLTLRAGTDGATARVHRGIVVFQSRVFLDALSAPDSPPEELSLPGKDAEDLRMLVAFMYPRRARTETFTADCIVRFCELGREYDMPELLAAGGDWLNTHLQQLVLPYAASLAGPNKQEKLRKHHEF